MCTLHMIYEIALEDSASGLPLTIFCVHHSHGGRPSIRAKALSRTNFSLGVLSTVVFAREVEDQGSGNLTRKSFLGETSFHPR